MVGVLIVVGIIGYGLVYSGLSQLPNAIVTPPQGTLEALWPGHGSKVMGASSPRYDVAPTPKGTSIGHGRRA